MNKDYNVFLKFLVRFSILSIFLGSVGLLNAEEKKEICLKQQGKSHSFWVEIADTNHKRSQGLMGRQQLAENSGMLFVYPNESFREFWMFNTIIPLDIAFINKELEIIEILQMQPCRSRNPNLCPLYGPKKPFTYALEVAFDQFSERKITQGAKLSFSGC